MIPRIRQVYIQNFKSIEKARVDLEPFTIFVGANGVGKSNFFAALEFMRDCVADSIAKAISNRGGLWRVRSRFDFAANIGLDPHRSVTESMRGPFGVRVILELERDRWADYAIEIAHDHSENGLELVVKCERCVIGKGHPSNRNITHHFTSQGGQLTTSQKGIDIALQPGRLALPLLGSLEGFADVLEFVTNMRFYCINPDSLREVNRFDSGMYLSRDGSNAVSVLYNLFESSGEYAKTAVERIRKFLSLISAGTKYVSWSATASRRDNASARDSDAMASLDFMQDMGSGSGMAMEAAVMSDGTLRTLAILLALYQVGSHSLIAIEEPESTIHPGAAEVLYQAMRDAARSRQIIITTHSDNILDNKAVVDLQLRVVTMESGRSLISRVSEGSREAIRESLFTAGQLLRSNELNADIKLAQRENELFDFFQEISTENQTRI